MTEPVRDQVLKHADTPAIQEVAQQGGMGLLRRDGMERVLAGVTTIEEILRVTQED